MKQSVQPLSTLIINASLGRPPAASWSWSVCVCVCAGVCVCVCVRACVSVFQEKNVSPTDV